MVIERERKLLPKFIRLWLFFTLFLALTSDTFQTDTQATTGYTQDQFSLLFELLAEYEQYRVKVHAGSGMMFETPDESLGVLSTVLTVQHVLPYDQSPALIQTPQQEQIPASSPFHCVMNDTGHTIITSRLNPQIQTIEETFIRPFFLYVTPAIDGPCLTALTDTIPPENKTPPPLLTKPPERLLQPGQLVGYINKHGEFIAGRIESSQNTDSSEHTIRIRIIHSNTRKDNSIALSCKGDSGSSVFALDENTQELHVIGAITLAQILSENCGYDIVLMNLEPFTNTEFDPSSSLFQNTTRDLPAFQEPTQVFEPFE